MDPARLPLRSHQTSPNKRLAQGPRRCAIQEVDTVTPREITREELEERAIVALEYLKDRVRTSLDEDELQAIIDIFSKHPG